MAGLEVREDVPLAPFTTFRIGGPARLFLRPADRGALERAVAFLGRRGIGFRVLGRGSNLLVDDRGVDLVLAPSGLQGLEGAGAAGRLRAEAGVPLARLIARSLAAGLVGLEALAGIPGSVGGAFAGNAGAGGTAFLDRVRRVFLVSGEGGGWMERRDLATGYRRVDLPPGTVAAVVEVELGAGDPDEARRRIRGLMARRARTQPLGRPSAGCVFRNPPGDSAGRLIEALGFKGYTLGGARVSERHANFIVNLGGARAADVRAIMKRIQERALRAAGVFLQPEIRVWSEEGE
ncbi:UDP-N-acetylmuramate dehydrogenase [Dissulfurirhabdus thermomarina]|nr:UDP-N-acetylmuramate dehydrogenase [Dissulfurirhabdus thermomarina]